MTIREFIEGYDKIAAESMKDKYIRDNIQIKKYLPYINKVTVANKLAKLTLLDNKTGYVHVNSSANYLFFWRAIIENYTDLKCEADGFYEEYDLLNKSGVLDKIANMIPEKEIGEFKMVCDMAKEDLLQNKYENHSFIVEQINRIEDIIKVVGNTLSQSESSQINATNDSETNKSILISENN